MSVKYGQYMYYKDPGLVIDTIASRIVNPETLDRFNGIPHAKLREFRDILSRLRHPQQLDIPDFKYFFPEIEVYYNMVRCPKCLTSYHRSIRACRDHMRWCPGVEGGDAGNDGPLLRGCTVQFVWATRTKPCRRMFFQVLPRYARRDVPVPSTISDDRESTTDPLDSPPNSHFSPDMGAPAYDYQNALDISSPISSDDSLSPIFTRPIVQVTSSQPPPRDSSRNSGLPPPIVLHQTSPDSLNTDAESIYSDGLEYSPRNLYEPLGTTEGLCSMARLKTIVVPESSEGLLLFDNRFTTGSIYDTPDWGKMSLEGWDPSLDNVGTPISFLTRSAIHAFLIKHMDDFSCDDLEPMSDSGLPGTGLAILRYAVTMTVEKVCRGVWDLWDSVRPQEPFDEAAIAAGAHEFKAPEGSIDRGPFDTFAWWIYCLCKIFSHDDWLSWPANAELPLRKIIRWLSSVTQDDSRSSASFLEVPISVSCAITEVVDAMMNHVPNLDVQFTDSSYLQHPALGAIATMMMNFKTAEFRDFRACEEILDGLIFSLRFFSLANYAWNGKRPDSQFFPVRGDVSPQTATGYIFYNSGLRPFKELVGLRALLMECYSEMLLGDKEVTETSFQ